MLAAPRGFTCGVRGKHATAKPLGSKSLLIREAITAHPKVGTIELAALINGSDARKEDKIKVRAQDVAAQRQAMKKAGTAPATLAKPARKKPGRKTATPPQAAQAAAAPVATASPVDLIDSVFALADRCGGMGQLNRLVDRLSGGNAVGNG